MLDPPALVTSTLARCPRCLFPEPLCLCADVPRLRTPFRFVILRHASELQRLTNTARWAALALEGGELVDYAVPGASREAAALEVRDACLLYPSPHSTELPSPLPRVIVVPDGTWSQARRMVQRLPQLQKMARLSLPSAPAAARLRRPGGAQGMSTLEAIAYALDVLGEAGGAQQLRTLHAVAVDRAMRLRGESSDKPARERHRRAHDAPAGMASRKLG